MRGKAERSCFISRGSGDKWATSRTHICTTTLFEIMNVGLAVIGLSDVAARAFIKAWKLAHLWKDAPREVHRLRNDLSCAGKFFGNIRQQLGVVKERCTAGESLEL